MSQFFQSLLHKSSLHAATTAPWLKRRQERRKRSPLILLLLLLFWSVVLGLGLAQATEPAIGTVDPVPARYQLGQDVYLENCATCHIAIPPAVLPDETWRQILQDAQHYGQVIPPLVDPERFLVWDYLRTFSRPLAEEEATPYRITDSRYFKALHPRVELPQPTQLSSCIACHPGAEQFNFRSLSPEWQDAP
jgi:Dihaem cytochrome c